jgi:hypothetical protein
MLKTVGSIIVVTIAVWLWFLRALQWFDYCFKKDVTYFKDPDSHSENNAVLDIIILANLLSVFLIPTEGPI